ncbi:TPA_asm: P6 [Alnus trirhavirus 1]|nr:TPA_asm: P6 [Alnus trirhavirus 1]
MEPTQGTSVMRTTPALSQNEILNRVANSDMMNLMLKHEESEFGDENIDHETGDHLDSKVELLMQPTDTSVHARVKLSKSDAREALMADLKSRNMIIEADMADVLIEHMKCAKLTGPEYEVVALTIKACESYFGMTKAMDSVSKVTSKLKQLNVEMDESAKMMSQMKQYLNQNNALMESQRGIIQEYKPPIEPPLSALERAQRLVRDIPLADESGRQKIIRCMAKYLETNPHFASSTFLNSSYEAQFVILEEAVIRFDHLV